MLSTKKEVFAMKKTLNRSLALALILLMMFTLAAPALAASKTMIVTLSAQVRSAPNQSLDNVLTSLPKGTLVTQTGTVGVWSIIEYQGGSAYVLTSRLSTYSGSGGSYVSGSSSGYEGSTPASVTVYALGTANVRSGPGTNYSKVGQLSGGDSVRKIGEVGSWALIEWKGGVAYVSSSLLSGSGSTNTGSSSVVTGNAVQATANVNVRSGPGTNYSILGWLSKGETTTKTGTSGNWTIISYNGGKGYVNSAYLKATGSNISSSINTSTNNTSQTLLSAIVSTSVYTGPSFSNSVVGYLDPGQTVTFLEAYGAWYRVQYGSRTNVYVYGADMRWTGSSFDQSYSVGGYVYAYNAVRVYSSASTSASTLGYLYSGDSAQRTGVTGLFTRIYFNGGTGYVLTSQISSNTVGSGSGSMSYINAWMYSRFDRVQCYTYPMESSSYHHGYLGLNERVWAVEGNSTWTKIQTSGYTVYVLTNNLSNGYSSGGYYGSNSAYGQRYFYAEYNTPTTATASGGANPSIPGGTTASVSSTYIVGDSAAYITWVYGGVSYSGWITGSYLSRIYTY